MFTYVKMSKVIIKKMSFLENLLTKVKNARSLSDASIKIYKTNLIKMNGYKAVEDLDFLRYYTYIQGLLDLYKPNTQNSILQSIVRVLEQVDEPELLKHYTELYYKVHTEIKHKPTDEKTEAEENNWIDWKDVIAKQNELNAKEKTFDNLLKSFVLSLYTYFEPRRNQDYLDMVVIKRKVKNIDDLPDDRNYYLLGNGLFVFNKFKTSKSFGRQTFDIPTPIKSIFSEYMDVYPGDNHRNEFPLLVKKDGSPLVSVNAITRILNSILGAGVGASMLRHSFLTERYGANYKDREIVAEKMGHSINTQHKYIKQTKNV